MKAKYARIALLAAGLAILGATLYFVLTPKSISVALIGIQGRGVDAIKNSLERSGERFSFTYAPKGSAADLLAKRQAPDIIIIQSGAELFSIQEKLSALPAALGSSLPTRILREHSSSNALKALPLLADGLELAWHRDLLAAEKLATPRSSGIIQELSRSAQQETPRLFFGTDTPSALLQVFSALVLENGGLNAYQALAQELKENAQNTSIDFSVILERHRSAQIAINTLSALRKNNALHPEWQQLSRKEVQTLMTRDQALFVIQSLSERRAVPYQSIFNYSSLRFPSGSERSDQAVIAPLICIAVSAEGKAAEKAIQAINTSFTIEGLPAVAKQAGLAPVALPPAAADIQAQELRSAVAIRPQVSGLYLDSFIRPEDAERFAQWLIASVLK